MHQILILKTSQLFGNLPRTKLNEYSLTLTRTYYTIFNERFFINYPGESNSICY